MYHWIGFGGVFFRATHFVIVNPVILRCCRNMNLPVLPYDPDVDNFGSRILELRSGRRITYEEAFQDPSLKEEALRIDRTHLPIEFTMFVLRKMAVHEKDFKRFKKALHRDAFVVLFRLLGQNPRHDRRYYTKLKTEVRVHPSNEREPSSTFRGVFTKIFCKKVFYNAKHQEDTDYEKLVITFPFKIFKDLPDYEIDVSSVLDDDFYQEIEQFLDEHFSNENAREICDRFLKNIRHFVETFDPEKSLRNRLDAKHDGSQFDDYLTTFPRFNQEGIEWMEYLYREYNNIQENFEINVPMPVEKYNIEYFQRLPERNFIDLYSFPEPNEFQENRQMYTEKFKKYLFFFVHASKVDSNPVFAIDDLLFECSKSLHQYKKIKEDIKMVKVLAKICVLHMRKKPKLNKADNEGRYYINDLALKNIKRYLLRFIENKELRLKVKYKTDLITWIPFRIDDICFSTCYSKWNDIKDFGEQALRSVLCPEEDPIRSIVCYNACTGAVNRFVLPENIDSLKNFIKLCNKCDVSNEPLKRSVELFMKKFDRFIETEQDRL